MQKYLLIITAVLFFLFPRNLIGQGEAAVPFLGTHPSPRLNGMAGAVTGLPVNDPFGFFYNPAQLGHFSQNQNFASSFYLNKTDWLPAFNLNELTFNSYAFNVGYNFSEVFDLIPLSIGFGYLKSDLDLGENTWTDTEGNVLGTFSSTESYQIYSVGIGIEYWVSLYLGYSYKTIISELIPPGAIDSAGVRAEPTASDFGLLLDIPVVGIIDKINNDETILFDHIKPDFSLSFGAALMNKGDRVLYFDGAEPEPLPRAAKLGWGLSFVLRDRDTPMKWLYLNWSTEALDELIHREVTDWDVWANWEHPSFPGDINFWDNVIMGWASEDIQVNQGWRIGLLDFFEYSSGSWSGRGYSGVTSSGFMFSTNGLFYGVKKLWDGNIIKWISDHLEIQYNHSEYGSLTWKGTEFDGITIYIRGF